MSARGALRRGRPVGRWYRVSIAESLSLMRARRALPPLVLVLAALFCLVIIGFACACVSDHPGQAVERAVAHPPLAALTGDVGRLAELELAAMALSFAFVARPRRPGSLLFGRLLF